MSNHTLIIAEAGVNHNGSLNIAKQLIDAAVDAGVDIIKFQTFKADKLVSKDAKKAEYQKKNIGDGDDSQYQMLKKLELSDADHQELVAYCHQKGIRFFKWAARSGRTRRTLDLIDINVVNLPRSTINFIDNIAPDNPLLRYSYEDHFIDRKNVV